MIKNRKRIAGIMLYVLLFIGGISLAEFPKSHAYFKTTNNEALEFSAKVATAYQKFELNLDDGKPKLATSAPFKFRFDINKGVSVNKSDSYTITVPDKCSVTQINDNTGFSVKNTNRITLPSENSSNAFAYRNGYITVNMSCDLVINEDRRDLKVTVDESVDGARSVFYAESNAYDLIYSTYRENIDSRVEGTLGPVTGTNSQIYEEFKTWIQNYTKIFYSDYNENGDIFFNPVTLYIINKDLGKLGTLTKFENALPTSTNVEFSLPGINIVKNADGSYTFKADDNLLGYARTNSSYNNWNKTNERFIFYIDTTNKVTSEPDKSIVNKAFDDYLVNYIYPDDEDTRDKVKAYVESQSVEGFYSLVQGETIPGFGKIGDGYYIDTNKVKEYANATYPITVKHDTVTNMKNYINAIFSLKQISEVVSPSVMKEVLDNPDSDESKMLLQAPQEATIYYFIKRDEEKDRYVLFLVWSDGKTQNNKIKFDTFTIPEKYQMTVSNIRASGKDAVRLVFTSPDEFTSDESNSLKEQFVSLLGATQSVFYPNSDKKVCDIIILVDGVLTQLNSSDMTYELLSGKNFSNNAISTFSLMDFAESNVEESSTESSDTLVPEDSSSEEDITLSDPSSEIVTKDEGETDNTVDNTDNSENVEEEMPLEESTEKLESVESDEKVSLEPEESTSEEISEQDISQVEEITSKKEDSSYYGAENNVSDKPKEMEIEESPTDRIPPIK